MSNKIILTDEEIVLTFLNFIEHADMDELAHVVGVAFGGKCEVIPADKDEEFASDMVYEFTPDENYCGAFDEIKKEEKE